MFVTCIHSRHIFKLTESTSVLQPMFIHKYMHKYVYAHMTAVKYIYLITRVSVQYRELLHEWAWYFHEPKASENAAHECNNRDMHANECNKVFIIHYHNSVVSLLTKSRVTRRSNALVLIKAHAGC